MPTPIFLVITAFTDETQLEELKKALSMQQGVRVIHKIITGMDALTAEKEIHRVAYINRYSADYTIKLDADMIIEREYFLLLLHKTFSQFPEINRISLPVTDFYTNRMIIGVHCFRSACVPFVVEIIPPHPDKWFREIKGVLNYRIFRDCVSHGKNPSINQSLRFGMNRAMKIRLDNNIRNFHWLTFEDLYHFWASNKNNLNLSAAICGAIFIFRLEKSDINWKIIKNVQNENHPITQYFNSQKDGGFHDITKLHPLGFWHFFRNEGGTFLDLTFFIWLRIWRVIVENKNQIRW